VRGPLCQLIHGSKSQLREKGRCCLPPRNRRIVNVVVLLLHGTMIASRSGQVWRDGLWCHFELMVCQRLPGGPTHVSGPKVSAQLSTCFRSFGKVFSGLNTLFGRP